MECSGDNRTGPEDDREASGSDGLCLEDDHEASGGDGAGPEAGREATSNNNKAGLEAALDSHDVQLEAWKAAGKGEVEQAELDLRTV